MHESRRVSGFILVLFLGAVLACASAFWFQRGGCEPGTCQRGDIQGGFPLTVLWEYPGGYSPLGGNGELDAEDGINGGLDLLGLAVDTLFFALFLLLVWRALPRVRGGSQQGAHLALGAPAALLLLGGGLYLLDPLPTPAEWREMAWRASVRPEQAALVGEWAGAAAAGGEPFTLHFTRDGAVALEGSGYRFVGSYGWQQEGEISFLLRADTPPDEVATRGLCRLAPAALAAACTSELKRFDPAAYPDPLPPAIPYPAPAAGPPYPAPPLPTPAPVVAERIQIPLAVTVTGNTLSLGSPAAGVLSLQRAGDSAP